MINLLSIGAGGAIGALLRYAINTFNHYAGLPLGTLLANWLGSLLLGLFTGWFIHRVPREWLKLGLTVGLCGGFTTMSTLALDTTFLFVHENVLQASGYLIASLGGGVLLAWVGYIIGFKAAKEGVEAQ